MHVTSVAMDKASIEGVTKDMVDVDLAMSI